MSSRRFVVALLACAGLAGCNTTRTHIGDEDPALGEAFKYDTALQIINPAPVYPADAAQPGDNGAKGAAAVKRYRTDQVKEPATMHTSNTILTGTSSGSSPH